MSEPSETSQWNWQWTATFVVVGGLGASGLLWTRGLQLVASVGTLGAVLLGAYVIYRG